MADLLVELFSEDIPARMQEQAAADFRERLVKLLAEAGLPAADSEAHVTPRRIVVNLSGLSARQPDRAEERRGPRVGAPDAAIAGFLKSAGLTDPSQAEQREINQVLFWFAVIRHEGQAAAHMLPRLIADAILGLSWPKSMRWGCTRLSWVRPLHAILAVFDGQVLPGGVRLGRHGEGGAEPGYAETDLGDDQFIGYGNRAWGHRFLAPESFQVINFADYRQSLSAAFVMLDRAQRRARINMQARRLAGEAGLALVEDAGLLDEVTGLVEWPVALIGKIDDRFLELPSEVLTTSMRSHQKYFALVQPDGRLAPRFIVVSNMVANDQGAAIVAGNERVLRARLSDAKFFWDLDRGTPLSNYAERLKDRIFHAKLGSMADKTDRLVRLSASLAAMLGTNPAAAGRAALLAKADLASGMVGEFPELQGVMGGYYAREQGEPDEVVAAIRDHYAPQGPSDRCPVASISVALALADKLDTLAGFFAVGERPTGSKDPFALRRAALGMLRIISENGLRLPLGVLFGAALDAYGSQFAAERATIVDQLKAFALDRFRVLLRDRGRRHDRIQAVLGDGADDDLVRLSARIKAVEGFLDSETGVDLLAAFRRAVNILKIEEKRDNQIYEGSASVELLVDGSERALANALSHVRNEASAALTVEQYDAAMDAFGRLRAPVDAFFTTVTVNATDPALRANRLNLLSDIRRIFSSVADFSVIEG